MTLNRTQCPHCFTTYLISEEQYRVSDGMVRCGTCRERFQARLISSAEAPKFDPRKAFIEPISEETIDPPVGLSEDPQEIEFAEPKTTDKNHVTHSFSELEESINSELSIDFDDDAPTTPEDSGKLSTEKVLANIHARTQAKESQEQIADQAPEKTSAPDTTHQQELQLPEVQSSSEIEISPDTTIEPESDISKEMALQEDLMPTQENALIDQVDELIDDKILGSSDPSELQPAKIENAADAEFNLNQKPPKRANRWLLAPLALTLIAALGLTLLYQLWMKQLIVFPEKSRVEQLMVKGTAPIADRLAEYDMALPVRRSLSKLELLSARTEPHPSRASTNLLRVSLINRAEIAQPLPWLELSLTDSEGRLVSRRQLAPRDYIYNNKIHAQIGPKELKKVTIELLAFPKQATGYELKLLSK